MNREENPKENRETNRAYAFQNAPRCTATSKRTHARCKAPAVRGCTVCRFHGARGGGPEGKRNGRYRHGVHTRETTEQYRRLAEQLWAAGLEVAAMFDEGEDE